MDSSNNEQTELLRAIWNEMKALGQNLGGRIDQTNAEMKALGQNLGGRIDQTNARLEAVRTELGERIDALRSDFGRALAETQIRLSTEVAALANAVHGVSDLLRDRAAERKRIETVEGQVSQIKDRMQRLEDRTGR